MRVFKTKWFTRAAKSYAVHDTELCRAVGAILAGKADNLGGGVYKKRLSHNRDRAIILTRGGTRWVYAFLFAKQDMTNIDERELRGFRELAKHYASLSDEKVAALMSLNELVEICHGEKKYF